MAPLPSCWFSARGRSLTLRRSAGAALVLVAAACGGGDQGPASCADVTAVTVVAAGDSFTVTATVSSADTGWDKYADAWEVRAPDGTVLGTRVLTHPHVDEQPFTRSLTGVTIPDDAAEVVVAARDSVEGFCGATVAVAVPHS